MQLDHVDYGIDYDTPEFERIEEENDVNVPEIMPLLQQENMTNFEALINDNLSRDCGVVSYTKAREFLLSCLGNGT